jgi:hypothetical protein
LFARSKAPKSGARCIFLDCFASKKQIKIMKIDIFHVRVGTFLFYCYGDTDMRYPTCEFLESFRRTALCSFGASSARVPSRAKCRALVKGLSGEGARANRQTHPLDALLEEAGDLSLAQRVHQLARRVMRTHQLHAIDEPV